MGHLRSVPLQQDPKGARVVVARPLGQHRHAVVAHELVANQGVGDRPAAHDDPRGVAHDHVAGDAVRAAGYPHSRPYARAELEVANREKRPSEVDAALGPAHLRPRAPTVGADHDWPVFGAAPAHPQRLEPAPASAQEEPVPGLEARGRPGQRPPGRARSLAAGAIGSVGDVDVEGGGGRGARRTGPERDPDRGEHDDRGHNGEPEAAAPLSWRKLRCWMPRVRGVLGLPAGSSLEQAHRVSSSPGVAARGDHPNERLPSRFPFTRLVEGRMPAAPVNDRPREKPSTRC